MLLSISDEEVHHLKELCNEVFGEENFIAQFVWEKTRKNDAKLFSIGHEYILVYAKSLSHLRELKTVWREPKPGARLGKVRQFATSNQIQIMVINIQSFQKDVADKDLSEMTEDELKKLNVINRENDRMSGRRPIEFIQAANPIVIIDEPQSVDNTEKSRRAIGNLNPHGDAALQRDAPQSVQPSL